MKKTRNRIHVSHSFMKRLHKFKMTHERTILFNRKEKINQLYKKIYTESENKIKCGLKNEPDSVTIRILTKEFMASDDTPALFELIHLSDTIYIKSIRKYTLIELWFRCWEWSDPDGGAVCPSK